MADVMIRVFFVIYVSATCFLSFADIFFDGFVADYLAQSKISEAKEQVSDAIIRVEQILNELKRKM